jgi:endonuclease YncB( thermonuclease family)
MARARERAATRRPYTPTYSVVRRYGGILALMALMAAATLLLPAQNSGSVPTTAAPTIIAPRTSAAISVRVVDGDTLVAQGKRIRLAGIDAPERSQTCRDGNARDWSCGQAAKERLTALVSQGGVTCSERGKDRYGRTLAVCASGGEADIGAALVRDGLALNYDRYTSDYVGAQREARAARRGIWQGDFEQPETWRHRRAGRVQQD